MTSVGSKVRAGKRAPRVEPAGRVPESQGRRESNKRDKRGRIHDAALALFLEQGVEATKLADVARHAGVAKGTLFLYASDKEDLVSLVMHDRLERTVERAFDTLPANAVLLDELLHVFGALLRGYSEVPDLAAAFVRGFASARGPNGRRVAALTFTFLHRIAALVHTAKTRGEVAGDIDALAAAHNLFALYFASILFWLSGFASVEDALDKQLRPAVALQLRGLAR